MGQWDMGDILTASAKLVKGHSYILACFTGSKEGGRHFLSWSCHRVQSSTSGQLLRLLSLPLSSP